jgi:hypothetical protein
MTNRELLLYSPNLSQAQVRATVAEDVRFFDEFEEAVDALAGEYPNPQVSLLPQGALAQKTKASIG